MNYENIKFITTFLENKSIEPKTMEEWIYSNTGLKSELDEETYFELISLNYSDKSIRNSFKTLIEPSINYGEFHKEQIVKTIDEIINKTISPINGIKNLYSLAEKGYTFLGKIDLVGNFNEQGKSIIYLIDSEASNNNQWDAISRDSPNFIKQLIETKEKLVTNKIILTGEKKHIKHFGDTFNYEE